MKDHKSYVGLILILLGLVFLLNNLDIIHISFDQLWPVFIILGGVAFWAAYFRERDDYPMILPGTILFIYGLLFWFCNWQGWHYMEYLWPVFLLGPGIGFFLMYFVGNKEKGFLVPGSVLTLLGLLFLARDLGYLRYWPVILIIIGIVLLIYGQKKKETEIVEGKN